MSSKLSRFLPSADSPSNLYSSSTSPSPVCPAVFLVERCRGAHTLHAGELPLPRSTIDIDRSASAPPDRLSHLSARELCPTSLFREVYAQIQFLSTLQRRPNTRRDYSPINLPLSRCEAHRNSPTLPAAIIPPVPRKRREYSAQIAINSANSHGGHRYVSPRP